LLLDREIGGNVPSVFTTQGISGTPVLSLGDIDDGEIEGGVRVSAAMLFGVGSNLEMTYMGGHEWGGSAVASSSNPDLYSFISDFGVLGQDGFDDTDRSLRQSITSESRFHSAELNYRRRTMFPYCRFQSSWLLGLRYLRYDDDLLYQANGLNNNTNAANEPRFFSSHSGTKNKLFGPQAGFDFWWNAVPGISLGFGAKGAWMQNDVDRQATVFANSLGPQATPGSLTLGDGEQQGTTMADFELKLIYRLTHSFTIRTSYYALAIDDVAYGGIDRELAQELVDDTFVASGDPRPFRFESLVLQGFTIGGEYLW